MSKVTLTVGISGSGKTTWAREQVKRAPSTVIVCRDDIRATYGLPAMGDSAQEKFVTKIQRGQIEVALLDGYDVTIADTNINKGIRKGLIRFAHKHGADVELVVIDVPLDVCLERNANRERVVPEDVIRKQFRNLQSQIMNGDLKERSFPVQTFSPMVNRCHLPPAIIVDVDGTVAHNAHRSPYDYSKVITDEPIERVIDVVNRLQSTGVKVLFLSGRKAEAYDDTVTWLSRYFEFPFELHTRIDGDDRPDWIVKNELMDRYVLSRFNVVTCIDDRDQVVKHYRARGITVLQVAPGRF